MSRGYYNESPGPKKDLFPHFRRGFFGPSQVIRGFRLRGLFDSLAGKILIMSLPVILATGVLFWCPFIEHFKRRRVDSVVSQVRAQTELIESALVHGMLKNERGGIEQTIESMAKAENFLWIRIMDVSGRVRFSSRRGEIGQFRDPGSDPPGGESWNTVSLKGLPVLRMFAPVRNMRACSSASCHFHPEGQKILGKMELGYSLGPINRQIKKDDDMIALFGFAFISVLLVMLYFIIRHFILKPLSSLAEGVRKTSEDPSSRYPIEVRTRDEIGTLAGCFNSLTENLKVRREATEKELDSYRASLLQAQKMEAIGSLAAGIAHDFNNLLTGIIGYAEIARNRIGENPAGQNMEQVVKIANKAAELTKQILYVGRKLPPERKPADVRTFMNESVRLMRRMVEENIELKVSMQADLPPVSIDASQMLQVLMNLVVNARDAMPGGGIINIDVREFRADEDYCSRYAHAKPGDFVMISVSDTGAGIPRDIMDRIFDPFFTTKEPGKGTGLGLAVTHSIVGSHAGWINVYSEPGKGTDFKIYLPAIKKAEDGITAGSEAEVTDLRGSETVMLVDDEQLVLDSGSPMLRELGYEVIPASSGEGALEIYRKKGSTIDLVILDSIMPKLGGMEVFKLLKEINPSVKVVLSSGYAAGDISKGAGFAGFLDKPYSLTEMAKTVRKIIGENR